MEKDTTYVALDDSKLKVVKVVVAILRPGATEPEQREMPKEPHHIQRLFRRLSVPDDRRLPASSVVGATSTGTTSGRRPAWSVRLGPPPPCVLGLLGPRPRPEAVGRNKFGGS
jgi:hypothetical protein